MAEQENKDKLFLAIDANAIVHRAFHAYPPTLTTTSGTQVNAVYGFTVMLLEILKKYTPEYIMCAFDTAKPTFRHAKYTDYKAKRKPIDPGLAEQFPLVEEVLQAFNIPIIKKEGYEADDILGTIVQNFNSEKWEGKALIVSGDRDLLQLISKNINVCLPEGNFKSLKAFNRVTAKDKYGYYPEQVVDYKAIVGDASDNIPGIKGLGEKTAIELLEKYGTLDEIYKHLNELKPRQKMLFEEGVEQAEFSRDLAKIDINVPISLQLQDCLTRDFRRQEVVTVFRKFEFRTLIDSIPDSAETFELESQLKGQMSMFDSANTDSKKDSFGNNVIDGTDKEKRSSDLGQDLGFDADGAKNRTMKSIDVGVVEKIDDEKAFNKLVEEISSAARIIIAYITQEESVDKEMLFLRIIGQSNTQTDKVIHNKFWRETCNVIFGGDTRSRETLSYDIEELVSRESVGLDKKYISGLQNIVDIGFISHILSSGRKDSDLKSLAFAFVDKPAPVRIAESDVTLVLNLVVAIYGSLRENLEKTCDKNLCAKLVNDVLMNNLILPDKSKYHLSLEDCSTFIKAHALIENSVALVLSEMENRGIKVDYEGLLMLKGGLSKAIDNTASKIYDYVGHEFNINSPKQLSDVLFNQLGLPHVRGKNSMSTREEVLNELEAEYNIIKDILEYRELTKLKSTYVEAFIAICEKGQKAQEVSSIWDTNGTTETTGTTGTTGTTVNTGVYPNAGTNIETNESENKSVDFVDLNNLENSKDNIDIKNERNIIKTDFKQLGTSSGRLSSVNPNLQNIPLLGEWAKKLRKIFIAREGFELVSIDYSQIEFRIMAHVSRDKNVMSDFLSEKDIHKAAAARIFNKEEKGVTSAERQSAKTINFSILYGQSAFGLSKQLKISQSDAAKYVAEYFNDYKGIAQYIDNAGKQAIEKGYVETMLGRRRYVIGLDSQNRNIRAAAIREAINMPIQGSAADLVKLSMIAVTNLIREKYDGKVFMLLQVHDELVFEAQEDVSDSFANEAVSIMENVYKFDVPLKVHKSIGKSLADLK